ncbi:MAG: hypothetical protein IJJ74_04535 [Eubacterium sp.]|nr:hypothetical protein [Eubacterium sp.]MBR1675117.1 hypothetical protein [Eubacterium sp.]
MITYSVKKNKRTRMTFRLFGLFLVSFALLMVVPMIMGYEHHKVFTVIISILFGMYGIILIIHSYGKTSYDITYEFRQDDMLVKHRWGETVYHYEDFTDLSLITPDNPSVYSIINIRIGKESFIIPFSFKQEFCDKVYTFLNERMTVKMLEDDLSKKDTE